VLIAVFMIFWGLAFGTVPGTWSNWVAHTVPDEAESAGGLLVAAINAAIASGAGVGGFILDYGDIADVFTFGSCVLIAATLLISMRIKSSSLDVFHSAGKATLDTVVCPSAR